MLWLGETEALVTEVDPIRGMIRVTMGADLEVEVGLEELTTRKPQEEGEERIKKKTKDRKEGKEIAAYNTTCHSNSTTSHPCIWRP